MVRETCDYVLREMTDPAGGFYSTQDADSEGVEGKFFVWTPAELQRILGAEAARTFAYVYDVTPEGNFEHGTNILNRGKTFAQSATVLLREEAELRRELDESRAKLLAERDQRVHPGLDDKVLVAWNGLMIDALAQAAGMLDEPRYLAAAAERGPIHPRPDATRRRPTTAHLARGHGAAGRVSGRLHGAGQCTCEPLRSRFRSAVDRRGRQPGGRRAPRIRRRRARRVLFHCRRSRGADHAQKDLYDNAVPSGNSLAALVLVRLGKLTGSSEYLAAAEGTLRAAAELAERARRRRPASCWWRSIGTSVPRLKSSSWASRQTPIRPRRFRHFAGVTFRIAVLAVRSPDAATAGPLEPLLAGKTLNGPQPAVYVCENFSCQAPVYGREAAVATWDELAGSHDPDPR